MMRRERCDGFTGAAVAEASGRTMERSERSCKKGKVMNDIRCNVSDLIREIGVNGQKETHEEECGREEGIQEHDSIH